MQGLTTKSTGLAQPLLLSCRSTQWLAELPTGSYFAESVKGSLEVHSLRRKVIIIHPLVWVRCQVYWLIFGVYLCHLITSIYAIINWLYLMMLYFFNVFYLEIWHRFWKTFVVSWCGCGYIWPTFSSGQCGMTFGERRLALVAGPWLMVLISGEVKAVYEADSHS